MNKELKVVKDSCEELIEQLTERVDALTFVHNFAVGDHIRIMSDYPDDYPTLCVEQLPNTNGHIPLVVRDANGILSTIANNRLRYFSKVQI